jgi:DNA-binding GntR family transcriptional regulator
LDVRSERVIATERIMGNSQMRRIATVAAPVRSQVVEMLRAAITSGQFAPGRRLIEKDLCDLMGVSRPSVREALRQVESEGLIVTVANRGPMVSQLSECDVASIYQVRGALEALAAQLFAATANDGQVKDLDDAVRELETAYKTGDVEQIVVAKSMFYDVLLEGSGNSILPTLLRTMNARITQLRRVSLASPKRATVSLREIRAVLRAIKQRDPETAFKTSLHHVQQASKIALASLKA